MDPSLDEDAALARSLEHAEMEQASRSRRRTQRFEDDFLDGVVHMGMSGMNEMGLMQFVVHKDKFVMSFDAADFDDDDLS